MYFHSFTFSENLSHVKISFHSPFAGCCAEKRRRRQTIIWSICNFFRSFNLISFWITNYFLKYIFEVHKTCTYSWGQICGSACLSVRMYVCLSVCLSVCLYVQSLHCRVRPIDQLIDWWPNLAKFSQKDKSSLRLNGLDLLCLCQFFLLALLILITR